MRIFSGVWPSECVFHLTCMCLWISSHWDLQMLMLTEHGKSAALFSVSWHDEDDCTAKLSLYTEMGDWSSRTRTRVPFLSDSDLNSTRDMQDSDSDSDQATELSRLDYGNATLVGILQHLLRRLQSVVNAAARLIYPSSRFSHITPLLKRLHWLKAKERIDFKVAVLVYKCLHGTAPPYLADELSR